MLFGVLHLLFAFILLISLFNKTFIYSSVYFFVCMCVEREKDKEGERQTGRERDTQRERERERLYTKPNLVNKANPAIQALMLYFWVLFIFIFLTYLL